MSLNLKEPMQTISESLFPYLAWNDLLRLRRTSKTTKRFADLFIRNKGVICKAQVEINETDRPMTDFLQLNFPLARIYLNNSVSGADFFETQQFQKFMDLYTNSITHLRLTQMSLYLVRNEFKLFFCLENLVQLEIDRIRDDEERVPRSLVVAHSNILGVPLKKFHEFIYFYPFPQHLNNLKVLKVGAETNAEIKHMTLFVGTSLQKLKHLSHLCVSSLLCNFKAEDDPMHVNNSDYLQAIIRDIRERSKLSQAGYTQLATFGFGQDFCEAFSGTTEMEDLKLTLGRATAILDFIELIKVSVMSGTLLDNVNAALFNGLREALGTSQHRAIFSKRTGEAIRSLVNLHTSMLQMEMPNLVQIVIHKTSQTSISDDMALRSVWPKLKILRVHADSQVLLPTWSCSKHDWEDGRPVFAIICVNILWKFLFCNVSRHALQELDLRFSMTKKWKGLKLPIVPEPDTSTIVSSCPNLTKLTLTNWSGTSKSLVILWGLQSLKEVCLDSCETVGNVSFIGDNPEDPAFLKLKKLKKLVLKTLEKIPKITNLAFTLVFRHLKLKELHLQNDIKHPLKSITIEGIRSLQNGEFAKSIERFPFDSFHLDESLSLKDEMKNLEAQFRSSYMI